MRRNHGVARWERLANRPFGEEPLYSKSPRASLTEKLMFDGCQATFRRPSRRSKRG